MLINHTVKLYKLLSIMADFSTTATKEQNVNLIRY